jgi:secondary thiamine-phosphate synthase enzyme
MVVTVFAVGGVVGGVLRAVVHGLPPGVESWDGLELGIRTRAQVQERRWHPCGAENPPAIRAVEDIEMIEQKTLAFRTRGRATVDVTGEVARVFAESGIRSGLCAVFLQHTSASLVLCENADPDVRADLETILARLAPDGDPAYRHDAEGPDDMAAHARSVLTAASFTIPVADGRLMLGTWQGLYLWEHRHTPHSRSLVVTVMGEP